jgi:hypothetical protein
VSATDPSCYDAELGVADTKVMMTYMLAQHCNKGSELQEAALGRLQELGFFDDLGLGDAAERKRLSALGRRVLERNTAAADLGWQSMTETVESDEEPQQATPKASSSKAKGKGKAADVPMDTSS